ncbi:hypothetical protein [Burkholderia ubonensis]|uniref:hypothetical protein n=1 Tax=Burkholderia ubonensis TaxID=101571 RepID=UPI00075DFEBE|nr:hypothetical protein [Burkholderia ubonensis]KUZ80130.1 hypothetical protein WI37_08340 [Burkholderia ubonensis]
MSYSGFFVRDNLGQSVLGGQDRSGWSGCPDIILCGTTPPQDPNAFTTAAGYATDYGAYVYLEQANYVYLRALNTTSGAATGAAWLYYSENDLVLWPSKWQKAAIQVGGMVMNNQPIAATAGNPQVCVTGPFVWTPPNLPQGSDHYCVVSWMDYPPHQDSSWTPLSDIPQLSDLDDLVNFIVQHPNMGWRNTVDVSRDGTGWTKTTPITGPVAGGQFYVGVHWKDMPAGEGSISYSIPGGPGDKPPRVVTEQPIPIYASEATPLVEVSWPPNFASSISITYKQGNTTPPKNAYVAPVVALPVKQMRASTLRLARELQPGGFRKVQMVSELGPIAGDQFEAFMIGSTPYRF